MNKELGNSKTVPPCNVNISYSYKTMKHMFYPTSIKD